MGPIEEVFAKQGLPLSQAAFTAAMDGLLASGRRGFGVDLSGPQIDYLSRFGGVPEVTDDRVSALDGGAVKRAADEILSSFPDARVTEALGVSSSQLSRLVVEGGLFTYQIDGRVLFPDWQFVIDDTGKVRLLPSLEQVLPAIAVGADPISVRRFMTVPSTELRFGGRSVSPRDWLIGGGDGAVVAELAILLGEQC